MCVCLGPAKLSNTVLYVGSAVREGKNVHVLGYQNTAQNLAAAATSVPSGMLVGNAMILPFPAAAPMGKDNVVDTSGCTSILKDIAEAVKPKSRGFSKSFDEDVCFSMSAVEVFDTGIYTVVLARDPRDIPAALAQVPVEKRPDLKPEIFAAYAEWYPGWQIALCCFNNAEAVEADPLLWWYEPAFPDVYFAPTLDSHTGGVPDLEAKVDLDHTVAIGSVDGKGCAVEYSETLSTDVQNLLPRYAVGQEFERSVPNGDFLFQKVVADSGMFSPERIKPGANPRIELR